MSYMGGLPLARYTAEPALTGMTIDVRNDRDARRL
jgi:hypothetical protein